VAALGLVVLGVGYAVMEVAGLTLVQRLASNAVLARALAAITGDRRALAAGQTMVEARLAPV